MYYTCSVSNFITLVNNYLQIIVDNCQNISHDCQNICHEILNLTYQHRFIETGAEVFIGQIVIYLDISYKFKIYGNDNYSQQRRRVNCGRLK